MKITVVSDLHLECGDVTLPGGDVLILSGDVCEARHVGKYSRFFAEECSAKYRETVYVLGNHEFYGGNYQKTYAKVALGLPDNVTLLENQTHQIDDVVFVGATLWTDMNKRDEMTMHHVSRRMNDFRCVRNGNRLVTRTVPIYQLNPDYTEDGKNGGKYVTKEGGGLIEIGTKKKEEISTFSPVDAADDFDKMYGYIQKVIEGRYDEKFVVCTHHAPSKGSEHPRYKYDTLMNGAYNSVLDEYILDHPQIKLWTHGHTHEQFDYMIGSTRVVCNPRGYDGYEASADRFELKYLEV